MELRFGNARYDAMIKSGYALDAIGALERVELRRHDGETDQAYRERLIVKLDWLCGARKPIAIDMADYGKYQAWLETWATIDVDGLQYRVAGVSFENGQAGAWLMPAVPLELVDHQWRGLMHGGPTTASSDDTKPRANHVRDAVEANR